jgi:hypothetical protein
MHSEGFIYYIRIYVYYIGIVNKLNYIINVNT